MSEYFNLAENMKPLFDQAEKEGKWLHCHHQDLWFAPAELRQQQNAGRFRWGAVNWQVRDPAEHLAALERQAAAAAKAVTEFKEQFQP